MAQFCTENWFKVLTSFERNVASIPFSMGLMSIGVSGWKGDGKAKQGVVLTKRTMQGVGVDSHRGLCLSSLMRG